MPTVVHTLAAIPITPPYVHALKDLYQNLQKIGIQKIGPMVVFEGLHWVAMTEMGSSTTRR